jgi:hexulose-6-phosphate isomerase
MMGASGGIPIQPHSRYLEDAVVNDGNANRRDFLRLSTCAVAAAGLSAASPTQPRLLAAETDKMDTLNIYTAIKGGGIAKTQSGMIERLEAMKTLGFDGIEGGSPEIADTAALRQAIGATDVPVHGVVDGVHWRQRLSAADPAVREQGRAALEQAVRDAYAIGGSSVLLVPGRVAGPDENHDHVWKRSIVEIRKVLPIASRLGIHILIENVWNGFCEQADQMKDYIDEIDSPWVGVYFDIGNVRKFAPPEDWIRTLGRRIVKLDVKDWGRKNGFCRLSEGDVNWKAVRQALGEIRFTGWATREGRDKSLEDTSQLMNDLLGL